MIEIVQKGHPALHKKAEPVLVKDITSPKIQKVIEDMKKALLSQEDGVGLAAPQIGVSLQIFIVSGRIFNKDFIRGELQKSNQIHEDLVCINPEIIKLSTKSKWMSEGCLSVRPIYGEVKRSLNATIRAYDEHGNCFERGGGGLLAHIFQHEIDHLNGILFIEKARNLEEHEPERKHGSKPE